MANFSVFLSELLLSYVHAQALVDLDLLLFVLAGLWAGRGLVCSVQLDVLERVHCAVETVRLVSVCGVAWLWREMINIKVFPASKLNGGLQKLICLQKRQLLLQTIHFVLNRRLFVEVSLFTAHLGTKLSHSCYLGH